MAELIETIQNKSILVKRKAVKVFKPKLVPDATHLTAGQAAKILGLARETVYIAIRNGKLNAAFKGKNSRGGILITKDSLEQFKKARAA